jgi:hypothetical protein
MRMHAPMPLAVTDGCPVRTRADQWILCSQGVELLEAALHEGPGGTATSGVPSGYGQLCATLSRLPGASPHTKFWRAVVIVSDAKLKLLRSTCCV